MALQRTLPNPENASLAEIEVAAQSAPTLRSQQRLMAIKTLLHDVPFNTVVGIYSITPRTLQRWIRDFNQRGVDGLIEQKRSGRPRAIPPEKVPELCELISHPAKAEERHWTGKKFHGYLQNKLNIEIGYTTVIRFLHEQNFVLKVPQPWPDRQDEALRGEFRQKLRAWLADEEVELWFADESGFEGDPRPRRRWAKKGEKTRVTKNGDHLRLNVTGAICPRTGEAFFLEFTHSDTDCFQAFLDEANKHLDLSRKRNLMIVDNASWHKPKKLDWHRFEPIYLPPYSPDFNPIERLWLLIKAHWFSDFIAKSREELMKHLDQALIWTLERKQENKKTCSIKT